MKGIVSLIVLACVLTNQVRAQDSLATQIAGKNMALFASGQGRFTGAGWDTLTKAVKASQFVCIGEDHFTSEIPLFAAAIAQSAHFEDYFGEIDPYSAALLEKKIATGSEKELRSFIAKYYTTFSFYALQPEFDLLTQLVHGKTRIHGTDQIILIADRLICDELAKSSSNDTAQKIYRTIAGHSEDYFNAFLKDQSKPIYLLSEDFETQLNRLSSLRLSATEDTMLNALRLSRKIYVEQSHQLRVQLMKRNLMTGYDQWADHKALFKYGANHMPKGESLLKIYDLGNLINNLADSRFNRSLHIMIVGKSGFQGNPFPGLPPNHIDENSEDLKPLQPLFHAVTSRQWHCFDMKPLRRALDNGKLLVNDATFARIIRGYDFVVIIPGVTAATFISSKAN